jgi:hypothetical protein
MITEAVNMVSAIEGLNYSELMDLPLDEFVEVRTNVIRICDKRNASMRAMKRG